MSIFKSYDLDGKKKFFFLSLRVISHGEGDAFEVLID